MRFLHSLSVITSLGVFVTEVACRGIVTDGAEFGSEEFDFIVIGGGTAGLTIAAR
jgi:hypothetical protein